MHEKVVENVDTENEIVKNEAVKDENVKNKSDKNKIKMKSENKILKTSSVKKSKIVKDIVENDVKMDAKVDKKVDEVKNLVNYFENANSNKTPTINHKPQEWKLRFDAKVFSSTESVLGGPIDL